MVLQYDEHTFSIRKTGKLDVTDPNGDNAKFGTEERERERDKMRRAGDFF